jgi:excisionase family DNA binding protein
MRFLTTGAVAAACQVSIPTVKRWIRDGHLTGFQTAGGHYRVTEEELHRFRVERQIPEAETGQEELLKVLIIDDDPVERTALADAFTWTGRYKVEVAQDGYEGLIRVGSFRPDVLVLDIRMPGLNGFQVCRRVKADPVTRPIRILAVSGYAQGDTTARAAEAGADAFLEKPLDFKRLEAEVDRLVGFHRIRKRAPAPEAGSTGP